MTWRWLLETGMIWLWWVRIKVVFWSKRKLSFDEICLLMKVVLWWNLSFDESCPVMEVVFWWKIVKEVIKDVYWWVLSIDESCLLMKVVFWWKLPIDENCLLMKVVYWWKLSSDGSCLLMKVIMVKEVISCDVSPVAMFTCIVWLIISLYKSIIGSS